MIRPFLFLMPHVQLTKRIEFSASHRYHNEAWDAARNRETFGACNNSPGHGHNYLLEVTVAGDPDQSGMVVNLTDLKNVLKQVLEEFDHKHLNLDTPYFKQTQPTTENIARVLWDILRKYPKIGRLSKVRLYEDEDLYADVTTDSSDEPAHASLTRRYHFSAAHRLGGSSESDGRRSHGACRSADVHGHNYILQVTICGPIDPETGMVTDLSALDRTVRNLVLRRFDGRNLDQDPDLTGAATGAALARAIWHLLVKSIPGGRLERIGVSETADASYEYEGQPA